VTVWKTAFDHTFPDPYIQNANAAPGDWAFSLSPPEITKDSAFAYRADYRKGQWARYEFLPPIDDVAALDLLVDVTETGMFAAARPPDVVPVVDVGGIAKLLVRGAVGGPQVVVEAGGVQTVWDAGLAVSTRGTVRWRWHSSGRSELFYDGQLVAYQNGVLAGSSWSVPSVTFGDDLGSGNVRIPTNLFRVRLSVFRREDALEEMVRRLPLDPAAYADLDPECAEQYLQRFRREVSVLDEFMAAYVQRESAPWQRSDEGRGPYSDNAMRAHAAAGSAASAWIRYLHRPDARTADELVRNLRAFLQQLADSDPAAFRAAVGALKETGGATPEACRTSEGTPCDGAGKDPLADLRALFTELMETVDRVAGTAR